MAAAGQTEAAVACLACGWLTTAPLTLTGEPVVRFRPLPDAVVTIDAHALAELQVAWQVERAFAEVDPW